MSDSRLVQWGAVGITVVFMGLLIFDAGSEAYEVPLPLYGTIGLIFGGGAALGIRNTANKDDKPKDGDTNG